MSLGAFARDPGVAMAFQVQLQLPSGSYTDGSGSADAVLTRLMTNYKCLGLSSCHTQNFLHLKFGSIKKNLFRQGISGDVGHEMFRIAVVIDVHT